MAVKSAKDSRHCGGDNPSMLESRSNDGGSVLLHGGPILTMEPGPAPEALAVANGRIHCVGSLPECRKALSGTAHAEVDLRGRCLMPGFVEPHAHMVFYGQLSSMAVLSWPGVKDIKDLVAALKEHAGKLPPDATVRGFGYDHHRLAEGRHPTARELDRACKGRPVFVFHTSGHQGVANSYLLQTLRIGPDTPDPEGGQIVRDERGEPTGLLKDQAMSMATGQSVSIGNHGPNFHFPERLEDLVRMVAIGSQAWLEAGITTAADVQVTRREMETYLAARDAGVLKNRVVMMYLSSYLDDLIHLGLRGTVGDESLSFGPVKLYSDGALTGSTARFTCPYVHDPYYYGLTYHSPEELRRLILTAHRYGLQTATHAQGDAGIEHVIEAVAAAQKAVKRSDVRHRIEHCGLPRQDQLPRIRDLNIWPVPQARYIHEVGDGVVNDLGEERASGMMPLGSYKRLGIPVVMSSDSPVVHYRPFLGIAAAVQRTTASGKVLGPEHCISVEEALRGYTIEAARSIHREGDLGSLKQGKWADLVVLSRNPLEVPAPELPDVKAVETWVAGEKRAG